LDIIKSSDLWHVFKDKLHEFGLGAEFLKEEMGAFDGLKGLNPLTNSPPPTKPWDNWG